MPEADAVEVQFLEVSSTDSREKLFFPTVSKLFIIYAEIIGVRTTKLCTADRCSDPQSVSDYGNGTVTMFSSSDDATGNTTISIFT